MLETGLVECRTTDVGWGTTGRDANIDAEGARLPGVATKHSQSREVVVEPSINMLTRTESEATRVVWRGTLDRGQRGTVV